MAAVLSTGCVDKDGNELFYGDVIRVVVTPDSPVFSRFSKTATIIGVVTPLKGLLSGFSISLEGGGRLVWHSDGFPCWEVSRVG